MGTELEIFLEEYIKSKKRHFCNHSTHFEMLWVKDSTKIREKAALFLEEFDIQDVSLGHEGWDGGLFVSGDNCFFRSLFLAWCIEKGYKTINDLFN